MFPLETRILVIDDMPSIRDLVKNHLKSMGYQVISEANDGEEGYKVLVMQQTLNQPIQLVISDWNMPHLNGLDLLKKIRKMTEFQQLPFVILTSEAEREQVTEAILAGVSQYVVKPFAGKIFEEKLKGAWAKHNKPA